MVDLNIQLLQTVAGAIAISAGAYALFRVSAQRRLSEERATFEATVARLSERADALQRRVDELTNDNKHLALTRTELAATHAHLEAMTRAHENSEQRVREAHAQIVQLQADLHAGTLRHQDALARLDGERLRLQEREMAWRDAEARLQQVFEQLADRVLETRSLNQKVELETSLQPIREHLSDLRKHLHETKLEDAKERGGLLAEMKTLQQASERINREAVNLTQALKGDRRVQGSWGELVLERVLESAGMRERHEYIAQPVRNDGQGERRRPDVVVNLPDGRAVVIDAKVSLTAFERAVADADPAQRQRWLKQHAIDLREQMKRLSKQDYDQLPGLKSLDFVLLFVPVEAALAAATQEDDQLLLDAMANRVLIVSPTTLMLSLRIIYNLWRGEHQRRNVAEIARRAGDLYDKVRLVVQDAQRLGQQLDGLRGTYSELTHKLSTDRNNLVRQVDEFKRLGAETRKSISSETVEAALLSEPAANDPDDEQSAL